MSLGTQRAKGSREREQEVVCFETGIKLTYLKNSQKCGWNQVSTEVIDTAGGVRSHKLVLEDFVLNVT